VQPIGEVTFKAIKEDTEDVAMLGVEVWCSICEEELDKIDSQQTHFDVITRAQKVLVSMLLENITRSEDSGLNEWNLKVACGTCLSLMANHIKDGIWELVLPWVSNHIQSTSVKHKECAVTVFGSVLEGPDKNKISQAVVSAVPCMLGLMNDQTESVR
jgi:importin subunit beta-1